MYAPLVVFGYKRKEHIMQTLQALNVNYLAESTQLYIFLDGAKGEEKKEVDGVREYVEEFSGNNNFEDVIVIKSEKNNGLAKSIINGVSEVVDRFGKVIVVEDDLVTTKNFLQFMNESLDFYRDDDRVGMIEGYSLPLKRLKHYRHDVYLNKRGGSWGWATWKDRWEMADWGADSYKRYISSKALQKKFIQGGTDLPHMLDLQMSGKIDSWAIRWCLTMSLHDWMTICPKYSMVQNRGMDGTGEHCAPTHDYDVEIEERTYKLEPVEPDRLILKEIFKKSDIRYRARVVKSIKARLNLL